MRPKISAEHLITFYFVAEERCFSKASELLSYSVPTVASHVEALQKGLGVKLAYTRKRQVMLTEAGKTLLPYAREVYEQIKHIAIAMRNHCDVLHIGVATSLYAAITDCVAELQSIYPHIQFRLIDGPSSKIAQETSRLEHDIAVVCHSDNVGSDLDVIQVSSGERMVLIANREHPLARKPSIELTELRGHAFILSPESFATRQAIQKALEGQGVGPIVLGEASNVESIKQLVKVEGAIGAVLERNVGQEVSDGRLVALPLKQEITIPVEVLVNKQMPLSSVGEQFIRLVTKMFSDEHKFWQGT